VAKAALWRLTDAEARKRGEQTGLDTLVVHALNGGHSVWDPQGFCALGISLSATAARLKLKGIDGGPHKRWSMWFNSTQREDLTWA